MGGTVSPYRHRAGRSRSAPRLADMSEITIDTQLRPWFTSDTLAAYLHVSDRLIRKWVAEGRLRSYKLDGCRRFSPEDVDSFVAEQRDRRAVAA
jgi:excisionase family DNA binding protein